MTTTDPARLGALLTALLAEPQTRIAIESPSEGTDGRFWIERLRGWGLPRSVTAPTLLEALERMAAAAGVVGVETR